MYYCGIDLGKKSSNFCIVSKKREVIESGKVRNRMEVLVKRFGELPHMRIVIEASTKAFWLADRLEELNHEVIVVDPGRTKAIGSARIKHDKLDARILAELCAADLLARVDRPNEQQRQERLSVVSRDGLVKARARLVNMVRSIFDSEGVELKSYATERFLETVTEIAEEVPETMWLAIEPVLASIDALSRQIGTPPVPGQKARSRARIDV